MTDSYRSSLIERLYREALELDLAERQSFLARRCGENIELQREVESLLAAHASGKSSEIAPSLQSTEKIPTAAAISIARTKREIRLRMVWALCLTAASVVTIRAANDASVTASANTPMSTARTQKFRRANQSFVWRRSFILLYQTMSVYFDASQQHHETKMGILDDLFGSCLNCYGVGRQQQECHSRSGERHLENEIR